MAFSKLDHFMVEEGKTKFIDIIKNNIGEQVNMINAYGEVIDEEIFKQTRIIKAFSKFLYEAGLFPCQSDYMQDFDFDFDKQEYISKIIGELFGLIFEILGITDYLYINKLKNGMIDIMRAANMKEMLDSPTKPIDDALEMIINHENGMHGVLMDNNRGIFILKEVNNIWDTLTNTKEKIDYRLINFHLFEKLSLGPTVNQYHNMITEYNDYSKFAEVVLSALLNESKSISARLSLIAISMKYNTDKMKDQINEMCVGKNKILKVYKDTLNKARDLKRKSEELELEISKIGKQQSYSYPKTRYSL